MASSWGAREDFKEIVGFGQTLECQAEFASLLRLQASLAAASGCVGQTSKCMDP